ncbi:MAG: AEC family transporter [Rhodospirillales bacterium]|nr:AEC family transporter [Rhodospirillales bacterium]MCB9964758.1 AEC family transporter [Rhodospirillales bacterium]MCB9973758.1 AEC family transporter [Rhodospirillales bacterium]MCB9980662.1 AEC family transporter [Rhodospirillales bacterium]
MDIFFSLIPNLIPLYILIALGYIGGKYMDVHLHSMAIIAIYFISPFVVFGAISQLDLNPAYLLLPLILFGIALTIIILSYRLSGLIFKDNLQNLIGLSSGNGNTGYYGLPVVLALFGPDVVGIYLLANFGAELCSITAGYYLGARSSADVKGSLLRVLKLPVVHAVWMGLLWNMTAPELPPLFYDWWTKATGAWVIIGMMLIGVALSQIGKFRINIALMTWLFCVRFIVWPLAMIAFIFADRLFLHLFDETVYALLLVIGVVPLAGNVVAYAATLNVRPGEAATVVLASTLFALFYIPLMFYLMKSLILIP